MSAESLAEDLERAKQRVLELIDEREKLEAEGDLAFWQTQHFDNLLHHAQLEVDEIEKSLADRGVDAPEIVPVTTEATPVIIEQVQGDTGGGGEE